VSFVPRCQPTDHTPFLSAAVSRGPIPRFRHAYMYPACLPNDCSLPPDVLNRALGKRIAWPQQGFGFAIGLLQEIPGGVPGAPSVPGHYATQCCIMPTDATENGGTAGTLIFVPPQPPRRKSSFPWVASAPAILFVRQGPEPPCRQTLASAHTTASAVQRNACDAMLHNSQESVLCRGCRALARPRSASVFHRPDVQPGRLNIFAYYSPFAPARSQPPPLRCHPRDRHAPQRSTQ
jgi:hypothetical protein